MKHTLTSITALLLAALHAAEPPLNVLLITAVEWRFVIEEAFMSRELREQMDVRDLNLPEAPSTLLAHEFRSLRSLPSARSHSLANPQALVPALRNGDAGEALRFDPLMPNRNQLQLYEL